MMLPSRPPPAPVAAEGYEIVRELTGHPVPTFVARKGSQLFVLEHLGKIARKKQIAHLTRLRHPNVARVPEIVEDRGGLTIASDLIEGVRYVDLEAPPLEVKLRVALDVLNGLSALHGHDERGVPLGLFHGDVSPANVIVGLDGTARLVHLALPRSM